MKVVYKHLFFFLSVIFTMSLASCSQETYEPEKYMHDGVWEGTGNGRNGVILVKTDVLDKHIDEVRVVSQSESTFAQDCINTILETALRKQSYLDLNLDGVSGATLTSKGVIDAINMSIDASYGISKDVKKYTDGSCDVLVIGAGGAGLSAAVSAAGKGKRVIVVEKEGIIGGNTNYSTGGINAAESSVQKNLGIDDSVDLFYDDTFEGGKRLGFPSLIRSFVSHSASTVEWIIGLGADLSDVGLMGGSSVKRTHRPKGGTAIGSHLMMVLKTASDNNNVEIRLSNPVTGLTGNGDAVCGAVVSNKDGSSYSISAGAVIVATGGFGANLDMVEYYRPELSDFSTLCHKGATGDAFEWVTKLGGDLVQMDQIQIHPTAEAENHILITEAVRGNGAILVNAGGKRFINEMGTRDVVSSAILSQDGASAWIIFDEAVRNSLAAIETYVNQHLLVEGVNVSALAEAIGMSAEMLEATMSRYAEMQKAGVDSDFGRSSLEMPLPLEEAPFYAVRVTPAIHHTMGGVRVDEHCHVLKADGSIIKGLYAAGEVTGGLHGANRLGGNGVADIVINGKIAGENAAEGR